MLYYMDHFDKAVSLTKEMLLDYPETTAIEDCRQYWRLLGYPESWIFVVVEKAEKSVINEGD